jgi:RNA polymerase sigma-70 factor (ECF subfamily)
MSDQELIENFIAGQTSSFNQLVSRWQKKIFHFAYRYTCSAEAAKDISQETFIRAYKNLVFLQDRDRFSSWLYRIAMNACLDHKKKHTRRLISLDELDRQAREGHTLPRELWTTEKEHPDHKVQRHELMEIIQNALAHLPEEQRIVVIMKQYQELKFTEIADILQESVNTVKTRMYSGLANLRQHLAKAAARPDAADSI